MMCDFPDPPAALKQDACTARIVDKANAAGCASYAIGAGAGLPFDREVRPTDLSGFARTRVSLLGILALWPRGFFVPFRFAKHRKLATRAVEARLEVARPSIAACQPPDCCR